MLEKRVQLAVFWWHAMRLTDGGGGRGDRLGSLPSSLLFPFLSTYSVSLSDSVGHQSGLFWCCCVCCCLCILILISATDWLTDLLSEWVSASLSALTRLLSSFIIYWLLYSNLSLRVGQRGGKERTKLQKAQRLWWHWLRCRGIYNWAFYSFSSLSLSFSP